MSTGGKKGGKKAKGGNKGQDQEKAETQAETNPSTETTTEPVAQEENKVDDNASTTTTSTTAPSETGASTTTTDPAPTETKAEPTETKPNLTIDIADPNSATPNKDEKLGSPKVETTPQKVASPKVEVPAPKDSPKKPETPKKVDTPKKEEPVIVEKTPEKKEPEPVVPQATVNANSDKKEVPKEASPESSVKKEEEPVIVENNSLTKSWQVVDKDTSVDTASDRAQDNDDSKSDTFSISSRPSIDNSAQKAQSDSNNAHERYEKSDHIYKAAVRNRENGDYDTALKNLHEAVETLDPKYFKPEDTQNVKQRIYDYTCEISLTHLQQKNFTEAIKYAQSVRNNAPNNIKAIYLLGQANAGKNDNQEALNCYLQVRAVKESTDNSTRKLIEDEITRLESLKKSETKAVVDDEPPAKPIPATKTPSIPEERKSEPPKKDEPASSTGSGESSVGGQLLGGFVGTAALTFLIAKFLMKQPMKKGLVAAGVVGVLGAIAQYFNSKSDEKEKKK